MPLSRVSEGRLVSQSKHIIEETSADFIFLSAAVQIALASTALVVGILSKQRKITR